MEPRLVFKSQNQLRTGFYLAVFLFFCFRLVTGGGISHFADAPLVFPDNDLAYWLWFGAGIPQFLTSNQIVARLFDLFIPAIAITIALKPSVRLLTVLFSSWLFLFIITFNGYAGHHYHGLIPVWIASIAFCFHSKSNFKIAFNAARYYLLFVFVSAALWKIGRGSVFAEHHFAEILKAENISFLMEQTETVRAAFIRYCITNTSFSHGLFIGLSFFEFVFILGFLSHYFDRFLFALVLLFVLANWWLMGMTTIEILPATLLLLVERQRSNELSKRSFFEQPFYLIFSLFALKALL